MGPLLKNTRGIKCSVCGDSCHLRRDGTVTRHSVYIGPMRVDCQGAGKPPRGKEKA